MVRKDLLLKILAIRCLWLLGIGQGVLGQSTQPIVAIHDSELTRVLESMPATNATPRGEGTTGKEWWTEQWHYFVMPESVKEALRSDGTAFTVVGDSNITAGVLLRNGLPRYPILISLASEVIRNDEIAHLTNYVAAGGFLFMGSSAFTRNTNGSARGDFAFADELGVHMLTPGLTNWTRNNYFNKQLNHRLTSHIPADELTWRMPSSSEEILWGISPSHPFLDAHDLWRVRAEGATVLATGDSSPFLLVKPFGKGYFIYHAAFQPLIGHGGFAPGMYAYLILRRAIEWAFESANLPIPKLSPWPYPYDAAYMVRHDLENDTNAIAAIAASAQVEHANGAKGDYYFCTGTLRDDTSGTTKDNIIVNLRQAVTNYGATIGPHNGGLKNPNNPSLVRGAYDYWHWGPDEALDVTPSGYASGKAYAFTSLSNSFKDVEGWLLGTGNGAGIRTWVACYFNATREDSYDIQALLNVKTAGEQKLTPFPHWTLSTQSSGKRYAHLSQPVSDWFVGGLVAQSLEPWHPPGVHTSQTMHDAIDFYYNLGALINIYSHTLANGLGDAGSLVADYVTYCANTNAHPRLWPANAVSVYQWWLVRSNAQIGVAFNTNGNQMRATVSIKGATHTNTAVEILVPGTNRPCGVQVFTNGVLAGENSYRINNQLIRVKVGNLVSNAVISYFLLGPANQVHLEAFDAVTAPALPSGWSTTNSGAQSAWVTQTALRDTAPNAAYSADASNMGLNELFSPSLALPVGTAQLSFRNYYDLEAGTGDVGYDGGVLEIRIGTNAFADVVSAGGSFVTGGYNRTISGGYGSALAGRRAWSGHSGGFVSSVLNLPESASGQTIQLRWRCGTDVGGLSGTGWRIDTVRVTSQTCLCCINSNSVPELPDQPDRTVGELTTLTVTNAATDPDLPGETLSYTLVSPPAGAVIDQNGVITWQPTEWQAPGTNALTTIVTDNGLPPLRATNSFKVVVGELNTPPTMPAQVNRTIDEQTTLVVTNTASDSDIPANGLTYVLLVAPTNAVIDTNSGVITWIPTSEQANTTNVIQTVATDYNPWAMNAQQLMATNSFTVFVRKPVAFELDSAILVSEDCLPTNNVIDPGETVTVLFGFKNIGTANTTNLRVTLLESNAIVGPSGPQDYGVLEAQGPAVTRPFTFAANGSCGSEICAALQLQDGAGNAGAVAVCFLLGQFAVLTQDFDAVAIPALPSGWSSSGTNAQTVWRTVNSLVDTQPNAAFSAAAAQVGINELISPSMSLPLVPTQLSFRHKYSLEAPTGAGTTGYDGAVLEIRVGTNAFTDILASGGSFVTNGYNRRIGTLHANPLAGRWAWSGTNGGFVTTLVTLPPAAAGQSVQLRWRVGTDSSHGGGGWWVDTIALVAETCCANTPPVLPVQIDRSIAELTMLVVTNTAASLGTPANPLTYVLLSPPPGAVISTNGVITWTPDQSQGPGTNTVTIVAINSGVPSLSATNHFVVEVQDVNIAPVLPVIANQTMIELTLLSVTNAATNPNIHSVIAGYTLVNPPSGMTIDAEGIITWTPALTQSPSTNAITTVVTNSNPYDPANPRLTATNAFVVEVLRAVSPPLILSTSLSNGLVVISWGVVSGRSYQLQYKHELDDTDWIPMPSNFVITDAGAVAMDLVVDGGAQRFYRVVLQP